MTIIAPSILSMDFTDTKSQINELKKSKATWLHFDVMDGHFVPNLTFGVDILKAMKKSCDLLMDVHVMIKEPEKYMDTFVDNGAQVYTFHYEVMKDEESIIELAKKIQAKGCKAGISIKPNTDISVLTSLIQYFDVILIMAVEPGFGGQSFDWRAVEKIKSLRKIIDDNNFECLVEVDGGINLETSKICKDAGVDVLVAGSYVFKNDIVEAVDSLC